MEESLIIVQEEEPTEHQTEEQEVTEVLTEEQTPTATEEETMTSLLSVTYTMNEETTTTTTFVNQFDGVDVVKLNLFTDLGCKFILVITLLLVFKGLYRLFNIFF